MLVGNIFLLFCICIFLLSICLTIIKMYKKNNGILYKIISLINLFCSIILISSIIHLSMSEIDIRDFVNQWNFKLISCIYVLLSIFCTVYSFKS